MSKILVVDDDVDLAELVRAKLSAEGHEVFTINTGEGAFELAKRAKPDIAILDIMLPEVTGYHICRRIRKDPELYSIAILIVTALGEEPEVIHGLEQGADDYIVKPFKLDKLMEKLASLTALLEATRQRSPETQLPGTEAIKREINHLLARNVSIAVCYIDMVGLRAYAATHGQEGQRKALEFMAGLLTGLVRSKGIYESFVAHMGGEHFAVLLSLDDCDRFCETLVETFDQDKPSLYTDQENKQGFVEARDNRGNPGRYSLLALSVGVAHNANRKFTSAKKVFEVLAQVRQMAQPGGRSVVFKDRRRSER